jgi:hypothetical protein
MGRVGWLSVIKRRMQLMTGSRFWMFWNMWKMTAPFSAA